MIALAVPLGILVGLVIGLHVKDETAWYPRWFLGVTGLLALVIAAFALLALPMPRSLVIAALAIIAIVALWREYVLLFAASSALIALEGWIVILELLLVLYVPATGYLVARVPRKRLWGLMLVPIVIFALALLP